MSRSPFKSCSEIQSQSAGSLASVLRGKFNPLLQDGLEEMVAHRLLFAKPLWGDGQQAESWFRPDFTDRPAELLRRLQLFRRALGYQAQIHVAVRPGLAARVRAEEVN